MNMRALKARHMTNDVELLSHFAPSALKSFWRLHLGRWPRLLHFAPLALKTNSRHRWAWLFLSKSGDTSTARSAALRRGILFRSAA